MSTSKNQIGVVEVPTVFVEISDLQFLESRQILHLELSGIVAETVLSDDNTAQMGAVEDVERSRGIVSVPFLFSREAIFADFQ